MKKGFTMIEVMVSIAITGIILALLIMIMNSAGSRYNVEKSRLYDSSTARALQLEIEDSIKEASYATCSFDSLGLEMASGEIKNLIYIKPQKPGTSPYMLVLKNKSSSGWELHRVYYNNSLNSRTNVNTWRQQGTSTMEKSSFTFAELTPEEISVLNSQVDSYMCTYLLSGLTRLASPPASNICMEDLHDYYKNNNSDEYLAFTSSSQEVSLIYLENIKYEYYARMSISGDNLVMDGIDNIEIMQNGRNSFDILIRCGEEEYTSSVIMRNYARGVGLEKK